MTCTCGHAVEDHMGNGSCEIEGCLCAGYEEEENEEEAE